MPVSCEYKYGQKYRISLKAKDLKKVRIFSKKTSTLHFKVRDNCSLEKNGKCNVLTLHHKKNVLSIQKLYT